MKLTDAQKLALLWLPKDGRWRSEQGLAAEQAAQAKLEKEG